MYIFVVSKSIPFIMFSQIMWMMILAAIRENLSLGLWPGKTQTSLLSYRDSIARIWKLCMYCSKLSLILSREQQRFWSDVQADLGLCCLHVTKSRFLMLMPIIYDWYRYTCLSLFLFWMFTVLEYDVLWRHHLQWPNVYINFFTFMQSTILHVYLLILQTWSLLMYFLLVW